jgi:hypothetical protein
MPRNTASGFLALLVLLAGTFLGCHSAGDTPPEVPCPSATAQIGVVDLFKCLRQGTGAQFDALEAARCSWLRNLPKDTIAILKRLEELREQVYSLPLDSPLRQEKAILIARAKDDLLSRAEWQGYLNSYNLALEPMSEHIRDAIERFQKEKRLQLVLFVNRPVLDDTSGKLSHEQTARFHGGLPAGAVCDITADVIALVKLRDDKNR